jgi:hypothetical protein
MLDDLGKVTSTLQRLLENNVARLVSEPVTVTPAPPDLVNVASMTAGFGKVLSLHLYHIVEDPHFKNFPGSGKDIPDVATQPMPLRLFYVLTAHTLEDPENLDAAAFLDRHKLFGAALKTMHDFPVITDDTQVLNATGTALVRVLDTALQGRDNTLHVVYQPLKPEESVSFWMTDDKAGVRLSAFYEVSVVMLEPERPKSMASGIVLSIGNYVFPQGTPQILFSTSSVGFRLPAARGGAGETLDATPARAALVGTTWPPGAASFHQPFVPPVTLASVQAALQNNGQFTLVGGDLTRDETRLVLRSTAFQKLLQTTRAVLVQSENPTWFVSTITSTRATFAVQASFTIGATTVPILPGTYGAALSVVRFVPQIGALPRELGAVSNEVPILVTPQIVTINQTGPNDFDVVIAGNYLPTPPLSPAPREALQVAGLDVELTVGGVAYTPSGVTPSLDNELVVVDDHTLHFTLTADLASLFSTAGFLAIRLVINGAEAPPIWLQPGGAP